MLKLFRAGPVALARKLHQAGRQARLMVFLGINAKDVRDIGNQSHQAGLS